VAYSAVVAMPHQHEAAVTIKPERRAVHAHDRIAVVRVNVFGRDAPPYQG